jgi:hypothetical protein
MRLLLALLLTIPAFGQQAETQAKPDAQPAAAKSDAQPAATSSADTSAPAASDWLTGSVDFGYRFRTGVGGNLLQYRSVVNLGEGPKLFNLDLTVQDPRKRLFDRMTVRASSWGGDPYNTAHLDAHKAGVYDLSADYRNIIYFNAIPSFANPFFPAGFDQRSFDIHQRLGTVDLTLRPGKHIMPYLGFWRNGNSGNGIETWVLGTVNQFPVPTSIVNHMNNYRGGVRMEYQHVHVTLEQGGANFENDASVTYAPAGPNFGNRTTPVLGQTTVLNGLVQAYGINGDTIYSKALATANPKPWLNLYGQFLFSRPNTDVHFSELAVGQFVSLTSLLFYTGQSTLATGTANAPHYSGNAGFELRAGRRLRVIESWLTDRYSDNASPLSVVQLLNAGASPVTQTTVLNYTQVVNYNQNEVDAFYDATSRLTLRGGWRYVWGNASVLPSSLSQTGAALEQAQLKRQVGIAGLNFRAAQKLTVNLDYEGSSSDNIYFRTSLNDYNRGRARVRYQARPSLGFQASYAVFDNQNPAPDIRFDYRATSASAAVFWTPADGKRFTFTAEYDHSLLRSSILYLIPQNLQQATSIYRDNANTATALMDFSLPGYAGMVPKLSAGGSVFISTGSRATNYYQPLVRLLIPLHKHVYWKTEWQYYGYGEQFYLFEGFRTHLVQTGLRLTR